jgi:hypothetical protein
MEIKPQRFQLESFFVLHDNVLKILGDSERKMVNIENESLIDL